LKPLGVNIPAGTSWSPPTRGRGLKHRADKAERVRLKSPPTRGRGLKLLLAV